jgi:hypothetical protein
MEAKRAIVNGLIVDLFEGAVVGDSKIATTYGSLNTSAGLISFFALSTIKVANKKNKELGDSTQYFR